MNKSKTEAQYTADQSSSQIVIVASELTIPRLDILNTFCRIGLLHILKMW